MIGNAQQAIRIGRQVDPHDIGAFIRHHVQKSRVLVREAVVILAPYE